MLGAVKGDPEGDDAPLFRLLKRRWKPLASVKRQRAALSSAAVSDEPAPAPRTWIEKPRQIYAHQKIEPPKSRSWNPWLWVK